MATTSDLGLTGSANVELLKSVRKMSSLSGLSDSVTKLSEQLKAKTQIISTMLGEIKVIKGKLEENNKASIETQSELNNLQNSHQQKINEITNAHNAKIAEHESQMATLQNEKKSAEDQKVNAEEAAKDKESILRDYNELASAIQSADKTYQTNYNSLSAQLQSLSKDEESLTGQLQELVDAVTSLSKDVGIETSPPIRRTNSNFANDAQQKEETPLSSDTPPKEVTPPSSETPQKDMFERLRKNANETTLNSKLGTLPIVTSNDKTENTYKQINDILGKGNLTGEDYTNIGNIVTNAKFTRKGRSSGGSRKKRRHSSKKRRHITRRKHNSKKKHGGRRSLRKHKKDHKKRRPIKRVTFKHHR